MVTTPQQRKQVVVKSISDIQREATVKARPVGQVAKAAALGSAVGEGLSGVTEIWGTMKDGAGGYWTFAGSRVNWLAIGLAYGLEATRDWVVPQNARSKVANIPSYIFSMHVLISAFDMGRDVYLGRNN
jgi:hypothetical protein